MEADGSAGWLRGEVEAVGSAGWHWAAVRREVNVEPVGCVGPAE